MKRKTSEMDGSLFITGASSGIGLETARYFRDRGKKVVATARSPEKLAAEVGDGLIAVECDVDSNESVESAVAEASRRAGPIEIVVNNAGYGQAGPIEEVGDAEVHAQFETNVHGPLRVIRQTAPLLREAGRGRIINISSAAGRVSLPFLGVYCATKFALEAISDALRVELRPFGVYVVLIEPGPIDTGFEETVFKRSDILDRDRDSPYVEFAGGITSGAELIKYFSLGPGAVAKAIYKAATTSRPRARYQVTLPAAASALAARVVPTTAFDVALAAQARNYLGSFFKRDS